LKGKNTIIINKWNICFRTYIAKPASSWIDDYFDWSQSDACCKMYSNGSFCPHADFNCANSCPRESKGPRPAPNDFSRYVPFFLSDNPDGECAKGGHAGYGPGVNYLPMSAPIDSPPLFKVGANYFMAYHTILKTSEDYYEAMRAARKIAANITETINIRARALGFNSSVEVFPYR